MDRAYDEVNFKTLDGLSLSGHLYPAKKRGPAIILTPGINATKDNFYAGLPEIFQRAGITALIYDPRCTGTSEGQPRNDIDPFKQAEDYSDAFSYLSTLSVVDPKSIIFWGVSLSAGLALAAAAMDKRICAVIAVAPIFRNEYVEDQVKTKLKKKVIRDREAQVLSGSSPFFISAVAAKGIVPFDSRVEVPEYKERSPLGHNPHATTIQSYYRLLLWESIPLSTLPQINPTPVMFVTPEHDTISLTQTQKEAFDSLKGPKQFLIAPGREHINVLSGDNMPQLAKAQVNFIWQAALGRFSAPVSAQN